MKTATEAITLILQTENGNHAELVANMKSIQLDAERSGYERGVREASEAFGWALAEDARKSIISLLTKKEDAK